MIPIVVTTFSPLVLKPAHAAVRRWSADIGQYRRPSIYYWCVRIVPTTTPSDKEREVDQYPPNCTFAQQSSFSVLAGRVRYCAICPFVNSFKELMSTSTSGLFVDELMRYVVDDLVKVPKAQVERVVGPMLGLFIGQVFSQMLRDEVEIVCPEFPLRKKESNQSTNLDWLLYAKNRDQFLLVELKTTDTTYGEDQANIVIAKAPVFQMGLQIDERKPLKNMSETALNEIPGKRVESLLNERADRSLDHIAHQSIAGLTTTYSVLSISKISLIREGDASRMQLVLCKDPVRCYVLVIEGAGN